MMIAMTPPLIMVLILGLVFYLARRSAYRRK
jgi:hypothetical protein